MINNEPNVVANFLKSTTKRSAEYNSKSIVLSSEGSEEKFINTIAPFFDKVVRVDKVPSTITGRDH